MLLSQYHLVRIASNNFISISYRKFLFNLITSFEFNWCVLLLRKTIIMEDSSHGWNHSQTISTIIEIWRQSHGCEYHLTNFFWQNTVASNFCNDRKSAVRLRNPFIVFAGWCKCWYTVSADLYWNKTLPKPMERTIEYFWKGDEYGFWKTVWKQWRKTVNMEENQKS